MKKRSRKEESVEKKEKKQRRAMIQGCSNEERWLRSQRVYESTEKPRYHPVLSQHVKNTMDYLAFKRYATCCFEEGYRKMIVANWHEPSVQKELDSMRVSMWDALQHGDNICPCIKRIKHRPTDTLVERCFLVALECGLVQHAYSEGYLPAIVCTSIIEMMDGEKQHLLSKTIFFREAVLQVPELGDPFIYEWNRSVEKEVARIPRTTTNIAFPGTLFPVAFPRYPRLVSLTLSNMMYNYQPVDGAIKETHAKRLAIQKTLETLHIDRVMSLKPIEIAFQSFPNLRNLQLNIGSPYLDRWKAARAILRGTPALEILHCENSMSNAFFEELCTNTDIPQRNLHTLCLNPEFSEMRWSVCFPDFKPTLPQCVKVLKLQILHIKLIDELVRYGKYLKKLIIKSHLCFDIEPPEQFTPYENTSLETLVVGPHIPHHNQLSPLARVRWYQKIFSHCTNLHLVGIGLINERENQFLLKSIPPTCSTLILRCFRDARDIQLLKTLPSHSRLSHLVIAPVPSTFLNEDSIREVVPFRLSSNITCFDVVDWNEAINGKLLDFKTKPSYMEFRNFLVNLLGIDLHWK